MSGTKREFLFNHLFESGNDCDVFIFCIDGLVMDIDIEWERVPPTKADQREYKEKVIPRIVGEAKRRVMSDPTIDDGTKCACKVSTVERR